MNTKKEQRDDLIAALEWSYDHDESLSPEMLARIREALIESSGDKASEPAKKIKIAYYASVCPQCGWPTERTDVLVLDDEHAIDLSAPSPAPTIKPNVTVEVEEAMGRVGAIMEDRIHSMLAHAATCGSDRESAQMRAEANALAEDLAVLKAALQPKVVSGEWVVTGEWFDKLCAAIFSHEGTNEPAGIIQPVAKAMLRSRGIKVKP